MTETKQQFPLPRQANFALVVLLIAYIFALLDRQILSLLVGPIRADLQITDFQMSLLQGLAFAIFYSVLGLPIGRLADRHNRKTIIAVGIFIWSFMTAGCGLATTFVALFIARIGVGVGEAALAPSAYSLLSDTYPPSRLPRALAIYQIGGTLGVGIAYIVGGTAVAAVTGADALSLPIVGALQPWQLAFLIVGLPGVLVAGVVLFIHEPPRHGVAAGTRSSAIPWAQVWGHMRTRKAAYGALLGGLSLMSLLAYGYLTWYPTFLIRTYGMKAGDVGLFFGVLYVVFGAIGSYGSARVSEFLASRGHTDATVRTVMIAGMGLIPMAIGPLMPNLTLALIVVAPTIICMNAFYGVGIAALQFITPNQMRGVVSAMFLLVNTLIGLGFGASLIAGITDFAFHDDLALRYSLAIVTIAVAPIAVLVLGLGLRPYRAALQSMK